MVGCREGRVGAAREDRLRGVRLGVVDLCTLISYSAPWPWTGGGGWGRRLVGRALVDGETTALEIGQSYRLAPFLMPNGTRCHRLARGGEQLMFGPLPGHRVGAAMKS